MKPVKAWAVVDANRKLTQTFCLYWISPRKIDARKSILKRGERVIPVLITPITKKPKG